MQFKPVKSTDTYVLFNSLRYLSPCTYIPEASNDINCPIPSSSITGVWAFLMALPVKYTYKALSEIVIKGVQ